MVDDVINFKIYLGIFAKNLFEEVEDHALIRSKLSKQEVQLHILFYKKNFYKKISLKNPKTLRKC